MGRIKKVAGNKHEATLPPLLAEYVTTISTCPFQELPTLLRQFHEQWQHWPFPRGDLYHWIPVLDRFDEILEQFVKEYKLQEGPQTKPFGRNLLLKKLEEDTNVVSSKSGNDLLDDLAYGADGDRELVESILLFSRLLMDNCGNRSLYSSSDRLGELLYTTSLSLLSSTLQLAFRLAIRYHYSRARSAVPHALSSSLLSSHYSISLDRVQRLAEPFFKATSPANQQSQPSSTQTGLKGKEKSGAGQRPRRKSLNHNDLVNFVKEDASDTLVDAYQDFGNLTYQYYYSVPALDQEPKSSGHAHSNGSPPGPNTVRRASGLSRSQQANGDETIGSVESQDTDSQDTASPAPQNSGYRSINISSDTLKASPLEQLLALHLPEIPKAAHYEFLHRLRVAKGMVGSWSSRLQVVELRVLAIVNLAYIYPESMFQQKILQQDSDEPRRLQIVPQLAELIRPASKSKPSLPLELRTTAICALDAISKHKNRFGDVCAALQVNVNHGLIFHVLQEAITDLETDDNSSDKPGEDYWRESLFSLLDSLPTTGQSSRTAETLISAGLFEILVKVLELRTDKAERVHSRILMFIMTITHGARDSLQTFANNKGFDVVADLVAYEVTSSLDNVKAGRALPDNFKSQVMDYHVPFFQQQTLRWLFKFINSMLSQQTGNIDRLIRNLIDSPQLLNGLREVIRNAKIFGSNIWSAAISIVSSFIHNEPTSYAVIVEAGLNKALMEAVAYKTIEQPASGSDLVMRASEAMKVLKSGNKDHYEKISVYKQTATDLEAEGSLKEEITLARPAGIALAQGILPATDAIIQIPGAFGAMCLNTAGLEVFLGSGVLEVYFEIFESPAHVKSLSSDTNTAKVLGSSFDELVRHHPRLKHSIIRAIAVMLARVNSLCRGRTVNKHEGAQLWAYDANGELVAGETASTSDDIAMSGLASTDPSPQQSAPPKPTVSDFVSVVTSFLVGFCENQTSCASLIQAGGVEFILDLATLPSLPYDFNNRHESHDLTRVVHMLVEHKPHLMLPAILARIDMTLSKLDPFISFESQTTFFARYLQSSEKGKEVENVSTDGTAILKALVEAHTLCAILQECFSHPILSSTRSNHTLFSQVNLADYYAPLVKELGRLHRMCLWEEILLQRLLPDSLKLSTKVDGLGFGIDVADQVLGLSVENESDSANGPTFSRRQSRPSMSTESRRQSLNYKNRDELMLKNAPALRYLLSQIPLTITPFLQGLGKSLVPKRRLDSYNRQNAYKVAESIADSAIGELKYSMLSSASTQDRLAYLIVVISSISQLIVEGPVDRPHSQCLTLLLQCFKKQGGLQIMNALLATFFAEATKPAEDQEKGLRSCALGGMKIILTFYSQLTNSKLITDSLQSQAIQSTDRDRERDRASSYYFSSNQFLVDLRVLVLSSVKPIWDSAIAEESSVAVVKCLIDILKTIMEADHENGALRKSDTAVVRAKPELKTYNVATERQSALQARGVPADLASEALYRCFNTPQTAEEYCDAHLCQLNIPRAPIPSYERQTRDSKAPSPSPAPRRQESAETIPDAAPEPSQEEGSTASGESESADANEAHEGNDLEEEGRSTTGTETVPTTSTMDYLWTDNGDMDDEEGMAMSIDNLLNLSEQATQGPSDPPAPTRETSTPRPPESLGNFYTETMSTIDDLDKLRDLVRDNLIDHVLDMLSAHEGITFELADLISVTASKAPEPASMQKEMGAILVQSLMSFQLDEDFRANGQKVASYANLLAIILQQKEFYDAAFDELQENFAEIVTFVRIFPDAEKEPSSPWVAQILLVLEKILAEDVQPASIRWSLPQSVDASIDYQNWVDPIAEIQQPRIDSKDKSLLFDAIVDLLPRVGKDQSLALSVVRILVILSRDRVLADRLADKHNIQRLFVMVKQLAGVSDERFQKTFMIVLRHIAEDDETICEAIRSEITSFFKPSRARQSDTSNYIRHMAHLIIRAPSLFLQVTNEMVKLARFEVTQRPQTLTLKKEKADITPKDEQATAAAENQGSIAAQGGLEESSGIQSIEEKGKSVETRVPSLEKPDWVTHYLLSQLLLYKDVVDQDSDVVQKDVNPISSDVANSSAPSEPKTATNGINSVDAPKTDADKKSEKVEYQPGQHPIYNYRCFILQCLTELLMSYSRSKIEFINFSSKGDSKITTPSKPRSGILHYLLTRIIPCGSLDRPESITSKKRIGQSNWAMCAIVGLCLKPNHRASPAKEDDAAEEPDNDLLFVRKFVLENAMKAFKDASVTDEPLDEKYGRLLSIADLFTRLLVGRVLPNIPAHQNELTSSVQKDIAKIMFEKNYITHLTNAIADIDLNFPNSRRVVKYILRPLKTLTDTAIELSQNSDISTTPGHTDDDNISTASSVSDMEAEREETPDLFRNSTLGILEPGREEEPSSDSSGEDEDMYDDEYGDEMEFEDELERDGDEVVSDDDEDLDGAGHMEGLPGDARMDVEVIIDGEDDQSEDGDDSEDEDDEDEDMDDDDEVEIIDDEMNGDDENDSLADDPENEWQDEDDGDDRNEDQLSEGLQLGAAVEGDGHLIEDEDAHREQMEPMRDIVLDLEADMEQGITAPPPGAMFGLDMEVDNPRFGGDMIRDEDDEEDEDEDEDVEDEEIGYEVDYDDEGDVPPWGWDAEDERDIPIPHRHHHHHHHHHGARRAPGPWQLFPPGVADRGVIGNNPFDPLTSIFSNDPVPTFRTHPRPSGTRPGEEGVNPLLQRSVSSAPRQGHPGDLHDPSAPFSDWIQMFHSRHHRPGGPISIINSMMAAMGAGGVFEGGGPQALHLHIGGGNGPVLPLGGDLHRLLSSSRAHTHHMDPARQPREDMSSLVPLFYPTRTIRRWQDEAQMLYGATNYAEKVQKVASAIYKLLVPAALEEEKKRLEQERLEQLERQRKAEEEAEAEEERLAKEKAEKEAREQREREEKEAAERAEAERAAVEQAERENPREAESSHDENAMEGIEGATADPASQISPAEVPEAAVPNNPDTSTDAQASSSEPGPAIDAERVRATFRGREVDITGLGIDLEYLNALPDELREEVLLQQLAEQRSQAAVTGEAPTEISPEFLNALPPDIRQEILQQEAADRRRRERDEARRQAAVSGQAPPARAEDMDPASFLASLDPALRNAVLLEQDDDILAQLPAAIAAEARALAGERVPHGRWDDFHGLRRSNAQRRPPEDPIEPTAKKHRRQIVQMLDKAGVATLLRLLFIAQQGSAKDALNKILENVSQNRQNRAEVLGQLITVLQEGSMDVNAIEKSFVHLSIRAKPQHGSQKTLQPLKRTATGSVVTPLNSDMSPATIIQQCLSTLVYLTTHNIHVPTFFLSENDGAVKSKSSKKGKAKESPAAKFALNSLLSLLDRPLILESAGCMEQLSTLLQSITHPLTILQKREKEKPAGESAKPTENPVSELTTTEAISTDASAPETTTVPESATEDGLTEAANNVPSAAEEPSGGATSHQEDQTAEQSKKSEEPGKNEDAKKERTLVPPFVPEHHLRLVVGVLAARECSAKTFRDTVSTISNLSTIPTAQEVFGKELIMQAQDLGNAISKEFDELIPQVKKAENGAEVQSAPAMTKFAAPSADQAKLLRVLTALDYLFDPKRAAKVGGDNEEPQQTAAKEEVLTTLYENSTFGPLWNKLSECLTAMKGRNYMLNVATILLPLVESLMVVCKNTSLKESQALKSNREFSITSPVPESGMESLFFRFTEEHRKILNELVRHNPRLMSGTFSLLVRNPKVLEFDNKRNYFTRRLHSRNELRHPQPPLQLSVSRNQVFMDSFRSLHFKKAEEMKYGKLSVRFHGEEGVDAGGVTREWFQVMARQMFNPDYALFIPVASDRTTFHPNKLSEINPEHLMFFKFIGRIIGKALYEGRALDCHFSRAVYKRILGRPVSIKDMESVDLEYHKSLLWMLQNDISDILVETFSVETEAFGITEVVDLIENGRNIPVTEENKQEYVQLVVEYRLTGSVKAQLEEFLKGFHDIVPAELISIFNEQELELLISGLPDVDVDDWKNNTDYHNYSLSSPQIQWFWRAVRSFDKEERAKLLQFVTGTSKVPLNGFKELEGMNGFSRFNIHRDYGNKDRLPSSHTCFNQLDLPEYESYETLRQRLYTAMTTGGEYFGFA